MVTAVTNWAGWQGREPDMTG